MWCSYHQPRTRKLKRTRSCPRIFYFYFPTSIFQEEKIEMILIYKIEYSDSINKQTNETSMSGNYETANKTANKTADNQIFTDETSEFGMRVFSDPCIQATYKQFEDDYKKKYALKRAYDKQEFLRKMRVDIRREYLTRKKQVKHLQKDAAIEFRNAEMSLQEHYASAQAKPFRIRVIDISAPLVSRVTLPNEDILDLETFDPDREFIKVVDLHETLVAKQNESYHQLCEQEQQEDETPCWLGGSECAICERREKRVAFGGCYDDGSSDYCSDDNESNREEEELACELRCQREIREEARAQAEAEQREIDYESNQVTHHHIPTCVNPRCFACFYDDDYILPVQAQTQAQELDDEILDSDNKWNLPMTAVQKRVLEKGEAAQKERDENPGCYYAFLNTKNEIDHAGWLLGSLKDRAPTIGMTDEERDAYYRELQRLAYEASTPVMSDDDEEEQMREAAAFEEYCLLHMIDEENAAMEIPDCAEEDVPCEPVLRERTATSASSSAGGSATTKTNIHNNKSNAATKARLAKQQSKKKFAPLQITINANRSTFDEVAAAVLNQGKIEINLPKKSVLKHGKNGKKREAEKWNRINAQHKQSNARGTRIANLPSRSTEYMNDSDVE